MFKYPVPTAILLAALGSGCAAPDATQKHQQQNLATSVPEDLQEIQLIVGAQLTGYLTHSFYFTNAKDLQPVHINLTGTGYIGENTDIALERCNAIGSAFQFDETNSRVNIRGEAISCTLPDGSKWESRLRGFVIGSDGITGLEVSSKPSKHRGGTANTSYFVNSDGRSDMITFSLLESIQLKPVSATN